MKLIFKNKGSIAGFSNWLKSFKEILNSLLIECDLKDQCFVSKCFTTEHTVVKYAKISFEDAGLEVLNLRDDNDVAFSCEEWCEKHITRIKIGIFLILGRFIQVTDIFKDTDFKLTVNFSTYKHNAGDELHAQYIQFKSRTNDMKVKDCNISEFEYISDDFFFDKINVVDEPMSFEISTDVIKNLSSISSIFVSDPKKDEIMFYTKIDEESGKWAIYAYDKTNESYDYLLGFLTNGTGEKNEVPIYKSIFFTAVNFKGDSDKVIVTISAKSKMKMRVEAADKSSFTVLSTVTQS